MSTIRYCCHPNLLEVRATVKTDCSLFDIVNINQIYLSLCSGFRNKTNISPNHS